MQAVYYPINHPYVNSGEKLVIHAFHDEYSLWFDLSYDDRCVVCICF
jgi:hypothetical protein